MAMAAAQSSLPPGFGGISHVRPHEQQAAPLRFKRRGKKVSWAAADQLCQIRMFLAEDAPSLAGANQDHLQVKSTRFMHEGPDLPPGFGSAVNSLNVVPSVQWKCPQKVQIRSPVSVEAGGESLEVGVQKLRESKVLEAVYPRLSVIPENPVDPLEAPPTAVDDSKVRVIPVTPVDDDSDGDETLVGPYNYVSSMQPTASAAAVAAAAAAASGAGSTTGLNATTAVPPALTQASSKEQGVDTSLLIQLLSNPSLVETLSGVRNISMVNASNNGLNLANAATPSSSSASSPSLQMMQNLAPNPTISHKITATTPLSVLLDPPSAAAAAAAAGGFPAPPGFAGYASSASSSSASAAYPASASSAGYLTSSSAGYPVASSSSSGYPPSSSAGGLPPGFGSFGGQQQQQQLLPQQQQQQQFMIPPPTTSAALRPPMRHNEQYFKDLIMQHGGMQHSGKQQQQQQQQHQGFDNGSSGNSMNSNSNSKTRGTRACAYYNTPKGCRNGSKCMFSHDRSDLKRPFEFPQMQHQQQQQQHKRMRG